MRTQFEPEQVDRAVPARFVVEYIAIRTSRSTLVSVFLVVGWEGAHSVVLFVN